MRRENREVDCWMFSDVYVIRRFLCTCTCCSDVGDAAKQQCLWNFFKFCFSCFVVEDITAGWSERSNSSPSAKRISVVHPPTMADSPAYWAAALRAGYTSRYFIRFLPLYVKVHLALDRFLRQLHVPPAAHGSGKPPTTSPVSVDRGSPRPRRHQRENLIITGRNKRKALSPSSWRTFPGKSGGKTPWPTNENYAAFGCSIDPDLRRRGPSLQMAGERRG